MECELSLVCAQAIIIIVRGAEMKNSSFSITSKGFVTRVNLISFISFAGSTVTMVRS